MALTYSFGFTFFMAAILKFIHDILTFVNPIILKYVQYQS